MRLIRDAAQAVALPSFAKAQGATGDLGGWH